MRVVEIIFSPTGGTEKVTEIISGQISENSIRIDLSNAKSDFSKCSIEKEDMTIISMPVFGSRPPAVAIERLKQINGNGAKCCLVCVYGNGAYDNTLSEMKDAAEESGFQVTSAIAAIAQHSIIPEYASERPDESDVKQLVNFSEKIKNKDRNINSLPKHQIHESDDTDSKPVPPSKPPLPKPVKSCIKCGICLESCPVQAINSEDFVGDIGKCIFCMRCVNQCPNESRKVDENVISAAALALKDTCSIRKENELFL